MFSLPPTFCPVPAPPRPAPAHRQKYGVKLEQPERTNEATGVYAAACVALSQELGVPVLDLWTAFQKEEGWQQVGGQAGGQGRTRMWVGGRCCGVQAWGWAGRRAEPPCLRICHVCPPKRAFSKASM